MHTLTIYGASDDLIEIEGAIRDEFPLMDDDDGDVLAVSDGSVWRVTYTSDGMWRIAPLVRGTGSVTLVQAPDNELDDNYSDRVTIEWDGPLWVLHGRTVTQG